MMLTNSWSQYVCMLIPLTFPFQCQAYSMVIVELDSPITEKSFILETGAADEQFPVCQLEYELYHLINQNAFLTRINCASDVIIHILDFVNIIKYIEYEYKHSVNVCIVLF